MFSKNNILKRNKLIKDEYRNTNGRNKNTRWTDRNKITDFNLQIE